MSDKKSNLGTAGLVVAGAAVVGAACYAAYEMFKESSFFRSEQPSPVSREPPQQPSNGPGENRSCPICLRGYAEEPFQLPCRDHFHRICLQANYILHSNEEVYKCPVCYSEVPSEFLNQLN